MGKKDYYSKNYDKIITRKMFYSNKRQKTNNILRLICKTKTRICQALNGNSKSVSTEEFLGIDIYTYRKRIEYQFTLVMNWFNVDIDHVRTTCSNDIVNKDGLKAAFCCKNFQPISPT